MEIMKLTMKEDVHCGTHYYCSFSNDKIVLFEKKYDIRLITLISMYHLKPLVSLGSFMKKSETQIYKLLFVLTLFRHISDH